MLYQQVLRCADLHCYLAGELEELCCDFAASASQKVSITDNDEFIRWIEAY